MMLDSFPALRSGALSNQRLLRSGPHASARALYSYEGTRGPRQAPPQKRTLLGGIDLALEW
jgi:hypothetical protein